MKGSFFGAQCDNRCHIKFASPLIIKLMLRKKSGIFISTPIPEPTCSFQFILPRDSPQIFFLDIQPWDMSRYFHHRFPCPMGFSKLLAKVSQTDLKILEFLIPTLIIPSKMEVSTARMSYDFKMSSDYNHGVLKL